MLYFSPLKSFGSSHTLKYFKGTGVECPGNYVHEKPILIVF